jgi:hypothetical protein
VALALIDAGFSNPWVGAKYIDYINREGGKGASYTPASVQRFIDQFDQGAPVAPFSFELWEE